MTTDIVRRTKLMFHWVCVGAVLVWPIAVASFSPLLEYRDPIYIAAGLAGVLGLALLLAQPLLVGGYLAGMQLSLARRVHRWVGIIILVAVLVHVGALWITSPPDVVDALLFRSPTSFSVWGVIALWLALITASLAALRRRLRHMQSNWRLVHATLSLGVVVCSVVHAWLIDGTMGYVSKAVLCVLAVVVSLRVTFIHWQKFKTVRAR